MAVQQHFQQLSAHLPQNTVVVLPNPPPMNRGALRVLF
jgi:hypothetical protein